MAANMTTPLDNSVSVDCSGGNDYDGRLGLRISSIFVIGFGSFLGMLLTEHMP
jgi:solute carrier family 39 (zinc transporter), member 1/2/3